MCTCSWVRRVGPVSFIMLVKIETSTGAPVRGWIDGFLTSATKMLFLQPHTVKHSFFACSIVISFISLHIALVSRKKPSFSYVITRFVELTKKKNNLLIYFNRFSIFLKQQRLISRIQEYVFLPKILMRRYIIVRIVYLLINIWNQNVRSPTPRMGNISVHSSRFASPELYSPSINVLVNIPSL